MCFKILTGCQMVYLGDRHAQRPCFTSKLLQFMVEQIPQYTDGFVKYRVPPNLLVDHQLINFPIKNRCHSWY